MAGRLGAGKEGQGFVAGACLSREGETLAAADAQQHSFPSPLVCTLVSMLVCMCVCSPDCETSSARVAPDQDQAAAAAAQ